jgi:hypothetical protein
MRGTIQELLSDPLLLHRIDKPSRPGGAITTATVVSFFSGTLGSSCEAHGNTF